MARRPVQLFDPTSSRQGQVPIRVPIAGLGVSDGEESVTDSYCIERVLNPLSQTQRVNTLDYWISKENAVTRQWLNITNH
jgi:hypothetical protein